MSKRDFLFYLAVFVALATSAATCANVQQISKLNQQMEQVLSENTARWEETVDLKVENQRLLSELWRLDDLMEQGNRDGLEEDDLYNEVAWMAAGEMRIYHYCPCEICTGKAPGDEDYGITKTGTAATAGRTVAVDPSVIPLGSEVRINGVIYIAEDAGVEGKAIDLYVDYHDQVVAMGTYLAPVWWR